MRLTVGMIDEVLALFDGGRNWIQDNAAVDDGGMIVDPVEQSCAKRFCLWGGFAHVLRDGLLEARDLHEALDLDTAPGFTSGQSLTMWNDESGRTWEDVEKVLVRKRNELEAVGLIEGA